MDFVECPACEAELPLTDVLLGSLGGLVWYRCRNCGWEWSGDPDQLLDDDGPYQGEDGQ